MGTRGLSGAGGELMELYEQYRPKQWAELIGHEKALAKLALLRKRGLGGRKLMIVGNPGTGKTTMARLIAAELSTEKVGDMEIDAKDLDVPAMKEIERGWQYLGWGKPGRVTIINEAHGLRPSVVTHLLTVMERMPRHVTLIYTTSSELTAKLGETEQEQKMFLSRCNILSLDRQGLAQKFAQRAYEIAHKEGMNGRPGNGYLQLARDCGNNLREMLDRIEEGAMLP